MPHDPSLSATLAAIMLPLEEALADLSPDRRAAILEHLRQEVALLVAMLHEPGA